MALTTRRRHASPEAVWAVLSQPACYASWVVGAKDVRDADASPAIGSRFLHSVGVGLLHLQDESEVLASRAPSLLVLELKAQVLGRALVELKLRPVAGGCVIEMREQPISLLTRALHNPLTDLLLHLRNVEALRRLAGLAEQAIPMPPARRPSRPAPTLGAPIAAGGLG